jgi:hypothetical protein
MRRLALGLGHQVLVALATNRVLAVHDVFGQGRGPVAGAPAEAGTALDDDAARVDGVGHDIAGLEHRGVLGEGRG